ncbi:MAG: hypothetical protein ACO1QB_00820 [Verrucomicrobiales bacterium]
MALALPILMLFFAFWLVFVIAVAITGLFALFTLSFLAFLGVASSSAYIGYWKKKPSAAIKAFVLQALGLIGAVDGGLAVWFVSLARETPLDATSLLAGSSIGLLLGLLFGLFILRAARKFQGVLKLQRA